MSLATAFCLRPQRCNFISSKHNNSLPLLTTNMIHLYVEHLLNIKTLSIQASLSTVSNKETKALLSADGRVLNLSHENETASIQLPINISPNQESKVKFTIPAIPSKELSFRVQLEEKPGVQNGALSNGDGDSSNLVPWDAGSLTTKTEICCAQCSSVLLERGRIQNWKDLPSQGWADMMEFWHCHKPHESHSHGEDEINKGYAAGSKLAIENGVGLVDIGDFVFAPEDCSNLTVSFFFHLPYQGCRFVLYQRHVVITGQKEPALSRLTASLREGSRDTMSPRSSRQKWKLEPASRMRWSVWWKHTVNVWRFTVESRDLWTLDGIKIRYIQLHYVCCECDIPFLLTYNVSTESRL